MKNPVLFAVVAGFGLLDWGGAARRLEPIAVLAPSDVPAGFGNLFGSSIAVSGDDVVVGAPGDPYYNSDGTGAVYVFRRQGDRWIEQAKLTAPDAVWQAQLGWAVDMDGDVIAAGAPKWEFKGCGANGQGAVYVFRRDDGGTPDDPRDDTWRQEAKLTVADGRIADRFGMSVAVSGHVIVAGGECGGTVEVFRWEQDGWPHQQSLSPAEPDGRLAFGRSVDLDHDRIVAGAYYNRTGPGAAYVFCRDGAKWIEEALLTPSDHTSPDSFGWSVGVSQDIAVVGAIGTSDHGTSSGSVYVFERDVVAGEWKEKVKLTAPDAAATQYFGYSVAADGTLVIVGRSGDPWAYLCHSTGIPCFDTDGLAGGPGGRGRTADIDGRFAAVAMNIYAVRNRHSLYDYARFQDCFGVGNDSEAATACQPYELTGDGGVDLEDFEDFMGTFVGP